MPTARARIRESAALALVFAAGLALRLFFLFLPVTADDDTAAYLQLARNWFHHGIYGFTQGAHIAPTLIRLPGYPLYLALVLAVFGHLRAALIFQMLLDLAACWLLYDCLRIEISPRAAWAGLLLALFCPFTAAYSAAGMTESLSVACVTLAIWSLARLLRAARCGNPLRVPALALTFALAFSILLRPDGVLLAAVFCAAIFLYLRRALGSIRAFRLAALVAVLAALPLIPWTLRNARTFHVFQPLAPRYTNNPGEFVPTGFRRWLRTWSIEYLNTGTVAWNQEGQIDPDDIPARACYTPAECRETFALIDRHNQIGDVTPALDAQFAALAAQRIRERPWDYYLIYPVLRVVDMGLRPRTELFPIGPWWWAVGDHPVGSSIAIALGLVNLAYVVLAVIGFATRRVPLEAALLAWIALRCLLLATMENPEQRYTLEFFPVLFLAAACVFAREPVAEPIPDSLAASATTAP